VQWLLGLVGSHVPKTRTDWEALAMVYNSKKSVRSAMRDAVSLKRKLRSVRASQAAATQHTRLSPSTTSTPKNAAASRDSGQQQSQKVSAGPQHEGPPKSLSDFDEVRRQQEHREQQHVQRVLALAHSRLYKILKTHRRAERRHRKALRDCITSLTVTIEWASAQQNGRVRDKVPACARKFSFDSAVFSTPIGSCSTTPISP